MALRGDLASVDLAQVFQMLALNKKVGLLSIQAARSWQVLYFDPRGVTVHHNVHQVLDRVVAALVRTGRLAESAVEEVRDHVARTGQGLADGLLAGGYVDPAELEDHYRTVLEEQIYDLFFCREAKFEFHENQQTLDGRDGIVDERFFFNCDSVIMEAARRIDEWTYISERVPTTAEVLVAAVDAIDPDEFAADAVAVFQLLDGRRNVARVIEATGLTNFQVCKALSQLLDAGAAAPIASEELVPLADECVAHDRVRDAISLYERAIELGVGLPDAHARAAKAYQSVGEYEQAIRHLRAGAELLAAAGDPAAAATALAEVRQLVPTDLQARERLVELTTGPGAVALAGYDGLAEGKELVELLTEFGDMQRVRSMLERLLQVAPGDPDLKKALVNVHVKAGDQKRVVELYESIAADLVRQQKPLEAIAYLQKILQIDRRRADISERMRKLYEFDERTRKRSRALGALSFVFALLVASGVGYWWYDEAAATAYGAIDVREEVARKDYAAAQAAYEHFVASHPLTTSVARARREMQTIAAERSAHDAKNAAAAVERQRALQALRQQYQQEWTRHRELFFAGRADESLAALVRIGELLARSDDRQDAAWAVEQQFAATEQRLRAYLQQADELAGTYAAQLASGDWQAARATALRLRGEFENAGAARRCPVPVQVVTRPAGARLLVGGSPLRRTGGEADVTTPAVVFVDGPTLQLDAELAGFRPRRIDVDAARSAAVEAVLEIVPAGVVEFGTPVQTGVAVDGGWLAVGLRGGRLGVAGVDGRGARVIALPGLRAVDGTPALADGRVYFLSNENTIECLAAAPEAVVAGWPVALAAGAATELAVADGRVAVVDREGILRAWEQASGRQLLAAPIDGAPSGPPTFAGRRVHVGTVDGRIHVFDAIDGTMVATVRAPAGLATRVLPGQDVVFAGLVDGRVVAVDLAGGELLWSAAVGRTPNDGDLAMVAGAIFLPAGGRRIVALDKRTGAELAALTVDGEPQPGVVAADGRVLLTVRRARGKTLPARDVLVAIDAATLAIAWEHVEEGPRAGAAGVAAGVVAVPRATGDVVLFR